MDSKLRILARILGEERIKSNVNLAEYTVTKTSGVAELFFIATNLSELIRAIVTCRELKINFFVFGSGSKISLKEVRGLTIKNRADIIRISGIKGKVSKEGLGVEEALVEVDAGVSLERLVMYANKQGLGGLEVFRELPGTVGGSLYFNQLLRQKLYQAKVLTNRNNQKIKLPMQIKKDDIILTAIFKLRTRQT